MRQSSAVASTGDDDRFDLPSCASTPVAASLYRTHTDEPAANTVAFHVLDDDTKQEPSAHKKLLGTFPVYMTSCETMWGVIIFIKFDELLGQAGLYHIFGALALSFACQILAASSLSAIATNGKFQSGGAYYMVVRSLGPAIGAAIGLLYFIGMALLASVEILGATEALHTAFHLNGADFHVVSTYWDQVIFGIIFLFVLTLIRAKDGHWVHHIGVFVMLIVVLTILACIAGIVGTSFGWGAGLVTPDPKLSSANFYSNLDSNYSDGKSFGPFILTLMYPTFIGIFQGANKVSELKNSYRSIPRGAFMSIFSSGIFYSTLFLLLAAVASSDTLRDPASQMLILLGWPSPWFSVIGTVIIGLGSALSCLDVAPRILQSLAADGYIPILRIFAQLDGKSQEPRRATLVTFLLCFPTLFIEDIETVATYASLAFLCMYATMNFSCFVLSLLNLHSWRPQFRYFHWFSALVGFILCLTIMFLMEPIAAGAIIFIFLLLIIYVQVRGEKVAWGHGQQGIKYKMALSSLLALEETDRKYIVDASGQESIIQIEEKNEDESWRPQLLCCVKLNDQNKACYPVILDFVQQLKGSKGLNIVTTIVETDLMTETTRQTHYYSEMVERVRVARREITRQMDVRHMKGFTEVITAPADIAEVTMIQTLGLGKLRPNTVVVCWPKRKATDKETSDRVLRFFRFLGCATAFEKAVVALKPGTEEFPTCSEPLKGTIDIWWVVHDGGLLLLLSHLLRTHPVWKNCRLRIFTAVDMTESPVLIQRALAQYLHDVRIEAEIHVVDISKADVAGFRNDWTLRETRYCEALVDDEKKDARSILMERSAPKPQEERKRIDDVFGTADQRKPEVCKERFLAAQHLKSSIFQNSSQAQLVVLNLPVPSRHNWEYPTSYLDVIDDLTQDLKRVLLVHGCGAEALSKFA